MFLFVDGFFVFWAAGLGWPGCLAGLAWQQGRASLAAGWAGSRAGLADRRGSQLGRAGLAVGLVRAGSDRTGLSPDR